MPEVDDSVFNDFKIDLPTTTRPPQVMLGIAHFAQLRLRYEHELPSGFTLFSSTLGPLLCGKGELRSTTIASAVCMPTITASEKPDSESELYESVQKYFQHESCDFQGSKDEKQEQEDEIALQKFKSTVKYIKTVNPKPGDPPGRYSVTLPWRIEAEKIELPNNFGLTIGRLRSTLRRLRRNPSLMAEYDRTMKEQIQSGILERVFQPLKADGPRIYYIPHQPVIKESSSTTKLRVVFDGSSGEPCINILLYRGPVYAGRGEKSIIAILIRIRLMPILLTCDIEKAFLMVMLDKSDRDVTRIMWPDNPMTRMQKYIVLRVSLLA